MTWAFIWYINRIGTDASLSSISKDTSFLRSCKWVTYFETNDYSSVIYEILYFLISGQQILLWQIFKELDFHKFKLRVKFKFRKGSKLPNISQIIVGNFGLNKLWVRFITHKSSSQGFMLKTSQNSRIKKIHRDSCKNSFSIIVFNRMPMVLSFSSQGIKAILGHIFQDFWRVICMQA